MASRSYRGHVTTAFEVLAEGLAPFVDERMSACYPGDDWILTAADKLGKRPDVLVSLRDPHFQLEVLNRWWGPAFAPVLTDEARQAVMELRAARNHWAHPDEDHPFDLEYATKVHERAEELLVAVGSSEADQMTELLRELRHAGVRERAAREGVSESAALVAQLDELHRRHDELHRQLEQERSAAASALGQAHLASRQLAELQTRYAAVANLRSSYQALQAQLEQERDERPGGDSVSPQVLKQLASAEMAIAGLQSEASQLRDQLERTRISIREVDPLETAEGRRWVWLIASLLATLAVLLVMLLSLEPT
ncbi:MAG: hypothetical protein JJU45_06605 [Acidimicrobiia bacterium]|nr:hypothetical protein [Acidimicrobiia bacterium]